MPLPKLAKGSKIVILTGAGISAESGIQTFRDAGGLWNSYSIEQMATPQGFFSNPPLVWQFYLMRRKEILEAQPNAAHRALKELEDFVSPESFTLVTQNIDGLHRRAGSRSLTEIHGSLFRDKCTKCDYKINTSEIYAEVPPSCPKCGAMLRPDVVWFGESLNSSELQRAFLKLSIADLFIAVGTSGVVYPVSLFVYETKAYSIYVGMEEPENADGFNELRLGKAGTETPKLVAQLTGKIPIE